MTIGQKIRKLRRERGLTQIELEKKIGESSEGTYVRMYETGQRTPKENTTRRFAEALGVEPEAIATAELNYIKAIHYLYNIFEEYGGRFKVEKETRKYKDGTIEDDVPVVYVSFDSLLAPMYEWKERYDMYQRDIATMPEEMQAIESPDIAYRNYLDCYPMSSQFGKEFFCNKISLDENLDLMRKQIAEKEDEEE